MLCLGTKRGYPWDIYQKGLQVKGEMDPAEKEQLFTK